MNMLNMFSTVGVSKRNKITMRLYMVCIVFVGLSIITSLILGASDMMMVITYSSLLLAIFPFIGINLARTGKISMVSGFQESYKTENSDGSYTSHGEYVSGPVNARGMGAAFGILMLVFTIGAAAGSTEIYDLDIPGGILLALSGFLALAGSAFYDPKGKLETTLPYPPPPPMVNKKEIIYEKEVVVKIRCRYCQNTFNETLDNCPMCGAKK
jgi:hypothetical protein